MGAWGVGVFENDAAADWLFDLEDSSNKLALLEQTFKEAFSEFEEEEYVESGCEVLAAAEAVALLLGSSLPDIEKQEKFVAALNNQPVPPTHLVQLAIKSIHLVMGEYSEQRELWEETGEDYEVWKTQCNDLLARLGE